jgi:hypothetical protein
MADWCKFVGSFKVALESGKALVVNNNIHLGHVFIILVLAILSFCMLPFPKLEGNFSGRKDGLAHWIGWVLGALWSGGGGMMMGDMFQTALDTSLP